MRDRRWWLGILHVLGYLLASVVWMVVLGGGLVLLATANPELFGQVSLDDLSRAPTGALIGIVAWFTVVQLVGMAVLAAVGALALPADGAIGPQRVAANLAFRRSSVAALAIAAGIGTVAGLFPAWLAEVLDRWVPAPLVDSLVTSALAGDALTRLGIIVAVAVAAPLCEEIVFRGYLWAAIERYASPAVAFVVTSVVFAGYHLDPGQVVGVLPIAFALGWVRWQTRSLWPGVALHFANNALALALTAAGPALADAPMPAWVAWLGLALTLAGCAAISALAARR